MKGVQCLLVSWDNCWKWNQFDFSLDSISCKRALKGLRLIVLLFDSPLQFDRHILCYNCISAYLLQRLQRLLKRHIGRSYHGFHSFIHNILCRACVRPSLLWPFISSICVIIHLSITNTGSLNLGILFQKEITATCSGTWKPRVPQNSYLILYFMRLLECRSS